ncbi:hypothetical protein ACF0MN_10845 [Legionella pneumophila]|uniref:hypothetical protein n=1 Tax=Legionella pneumophila TaxID=446 RepID=UPI002AF9DA7F|nr:hypothetical protein [Legionella pneumophila]
MKKIIFSFLMIIVSTSTFAWIESDYDDQYRNQTQQLSELNDRLDVLELERAHQRESQTWDQLFQSQNEIDKQLGFK